LKMAEKNFTSFTCYCLRIRPLSPCCFFCLAKERKIALLMCVNRGSVCNFRQPGGRGSKRGFVLVYKCVSSFSCQILCGFHMPCVHLEEFKLRFSESESIWASLFP
jgi:hypothetical protein